MSADGIADTAGHGSKGSQAWRCFIVLQTGSLCGHQGSVGGVLSLSLRFRCDVLLNSSLKGPPGFGLAVSLSTQLVCHAGVDHGCQYCWFSQKMEMVENKGKLVL
jgi:hypothetical protein